MKQILYAALLSYLLFTLLMVVYCLWDDRANEIFYSFLIGLPQLILPILLAVTFIHFAKATSFLKSLNSFLKIIGTGLFLFVSATFLLFILDGIPSKNDLEFVFIFCLLTFVSYGIVYKYLTRKRVL